MGIPSLSISPSGVAYYNARENGFRSEGSRLASLANLRKEKLTGEMSVKSSKRVNQVVKWAAYLIANDVQAPIHKDRGAALKPVLITLTLASEQKHSDKVIKAQLLNQFLIELRDVYKVGYYIWKAERAENNRLHFHLIIDRYIHWKLVRSAWNRIQNKLGYVSRYASQMGMLSRNEYFKLRRRTGSFSDVELDKAWDFGVKSRWLSPNTLDIHSVRKVKNLAAYMAKYMAKEVGAGEVEGRYWGCSQLLSKLRTLQLHEDQSLSNYMYSLYQKFDLECYIHDHGHVVFFNHNMWASEECERLRSLLLSYIVQMFNPS